MPNILVTGGAGFIGSHTCVALLEAGYDIIVADNFSNSKPEALNRIKTITGKDCWSLRRWKRYLPKIKLMP